MTLFPSLQIRGGVSASARSRGVIFITKCGSQAGCLAGLDPDDPSQICEPSRSLLGNLRGGNHLSTLVLHAVRAKLTDFRRSRPNCLTPSLPVVMWLCQSLRTAGYQTRATAIALW